MTTINISEELKKQSIEDFDWNGHMTSQETNTCIPIEEENRDNSTGQIRIQYL